MTAPKLDLAKLDLYAILCVDETATEKEIVKSYRKQALKCHPDKNPDNPDAVEVFHKLSKALEILTDAAARVAYDKIQKAKKAAEKRHKELDSKRKKLKEDLEGRENAAQAQREFDISAKQNFQVEIERLRKEGSKLLQREQELLLEEIRKKQEVVKDDDSKEDSVTPKLKVKWKAKKGDEANGGYSYTILHTMFSKYGDVLNLVVSSRRNGSAILELSSQYAAEMAVQSEKGLTENPLTLTWLEGQPPLGSTVAAEVQSQPDTSDVRTEERFTQPPQAKIDEGEPWSAYQSTAERDYECLVLMKMRQAQERQRLIEQMKREDEEDT